MVKGFKIGIMNNVLSYLLLVRFLAYRPRVLDAWVARRLETARKSFEARHTVRARRIHINLPAIVNGQAVAQMEVGHLRPAFSQHLTILCLTGEGGSGKTSLACQVARRAMQAERTERLNPSCAMIPVLLEPTLRPEDTSSDEDLAKLVRLQLSQMLDESMDDAQELVLHLLRRKRLLLIIDGVSEMAAEHRRIFLPNDPDYPARSILITSRNREELRDTPRTTIETMRIEGTRLSSFLEAYLVATGEKQKFEDSEFFAICSRLSQLVGDGDTTVLLAKMYADLVVAAKNRSVDPALLPQSVPDLVLRYLRILNDRIEEGKLSDREVKEAAQRIAWESLSKDFQPRPVNRNRLYAAYPEAVDIDAQVGYLESRLGILAEEDPSSSLLRFGLDPLAEYLAAIHLVESAGMDEAKWKSFLAKVHDLDLKAPEVRGFFRALRESCSADLTGQTVPAFVIEELNSRLST